jgi:hypothetical protein
MWLSESRKGNFVNEENVCTTLFLQKECLQHLGYMVKAIIIHDEKSTIILKILEEQ